MMLRIKKVEYISEYRLRLLFSNGKIKVVNFAHWLEEGGELIRPLQNLSYFKKVRLDGFNYTICWPNGADFSPDVLYEFGESEKKSVSTVKRRRRPSNSTNSSSESKLPTNISKSRN